jgi:hypothetical protein
MLGNISENIFVEDIREFFFFFLTVHLSIYILVINQLDAQILVLQ